MSQFPPNPGPSAPQQGWQGPPPQQPGGYPPNVPPQQWGPQGAPYQQPSGSKTGLFLVLGLLALVVIGGGVFLMSNSDSDGGGGSSPEDAVRNYISASESGDCGRMVDSVTKGSWAFFTGDLSAASASREDAVSWCEGNIEAATAAGAATLGGEVDGMEVTEESGDQATVTMTVTGADGQSTTMDLAVAKEDGTWKIDLAGGFGDIGGEMPEDFDVPEDIDQQIEDLEEEIGTDFTIPED
jgi:hypothetical protein